MASPVPKWAVRAAVAQVLSRVPGGPEVRYVVQRYVTRSLPFPDKELLGRFQIGCEHLAAIERHDPSFDYGNSHFFEFGAGWDLGMGLFLRAAGVGRQTLVDLNRFVRPELVHHALTRLRGFIAHPPSDFPCGDKLDLQKLPTSFVANEFEVDGALRELGIDYRAPADARRTGLPAGSVDCVTSSLTLEHVPLPEIRTIFAELSRILRPGGLFCSKVDMSDHFSHSDPSLGSFHFLRFDERTWNLVNADMLYQNRLRASAYLDAATEAGFELLEVDRRYPRGCDPETSPLPPVHPSFTGYKDRRDLLAHKLYFVARKRAG
jgi:SAM-dependent methyltransferase